MSPAVGAAECAHGHAMTPANTIHREGETCTRCRECSRTWQRNHRGKIADRLKCQGSLAQAVRQHLEGKIGTMQLKHALVQYEKAAERGPTPAEQTLAKIRELLG